VKASIYYTRVGDNLTIYCEDIVYEDDQRLDTHKILPREIGEHLANRIREDNGLIPEDAVIGRICKHYFTNQWFDILEFYDTDDRFLGYYSDIATPMEKKDGAYYLHDLVLDLWIYPEGRLKELDWDEFDQAVQRGQISLAHQQKAVETLRWLVAEARSGRFPGPYLFAKKTNG
jgi:predicted RNA-binding protein associated with RNAse of E/G family